MGMHRGKEGVQFIELLADLGDALGYEVKREWPIPGTGYHPQKIDLCWFRDGSDTAPFFAFEIESRDVPAGANNAQKVFAKSSQQLLKPLFLFHIFLDAPRSSQRFEDLIASYGKFNYGTYQAGERDRAALVRDIFAQHRRVSGDIVPGRVLRAIAACDGLGLKPRMTCHLLRELNFNRLTHTLLLTLGWATLEHEEVLNEFIDELEASFANRAVPLQDYPTFGGSWQIPVHLALLAGHREPRAAKAIIQWQRNEDYIPMITPIFGRNVDYDMFVLGFSPTLWAMVVALAGNSHRLAPFVCDQMLAICEDNYFPAAFLPFHVAWLMHVAAPWEECREQFARARTLLTMVPCDHSHLLEPPLALEMEGGFPVSARPLWPPESAGVTEPPTLEEFRDKALTLCGASLDSLSRLAIRFLVTDDALRDGSKVITGRLRDFIAKG